MGRLARSAAAWGAVVLVPLAGCGGGESSKTAAKATTVCPAPKQDQLTPVVMAVPDSPVPVKGSDGRYHVVYELDLANYARSDATVQNVEVFDPSSGHVVVSLPASQFVKRFESREKNPGQLDPGGHGLLAMHVSFASPSAIPSALEHRLLLANVEPSPVTETGACTALAAPTDLVLSPPLRGARYLAGDGCCDSTLHVRALLPVNGRVRDAQRFAIDWEQLDDHGRIYNGPRDDLKSYTIYGQEIHAAADARVHTVLDGLPQEVPGAFNKSLPLSETDGNSVILDLGHGRYAFYAHMQPGSIRVKPGETVKRGQVLGLVGNSGNTLAPHVHFHVMDGPSPIDSNGLPYVLSSFSVSERGVSTEVFGQAESGGTPLQVEPVPVPGTHHDELPLDLSVVTFG